MVGDRNPLEAMVRAERSRLVATARRWLPNEHEAEDVVQETLMAVWARMKTQPPRQVRAYVYRAVRLNAMKRRIRRVEHQPLDTDIEAPPLDQASQVWDVDPIMLERALRGLPQAQQAALRMRYYLNLTFREIGLALSVSTYTAASRCRYGIASLRRQFSRQDGVENPTASHKKD